MKDNIFHVTEFKFISALVATALLRTHRGDALKVRTLLREALEERAEEFLRNVDERLVYVSDHADSKASGEIMLEKSDREDVS